MTAKPITEIRSPFSGGLATRLQPITNNMLKLLVSGSSLWYFLPHPSPLPLGEGMFALPVFYSNDFRANPPANIFKDAAYNSPSPSGRGQG